MVGLENLILMLCPLLAMTAIDCLLYTSYNEIEAKPRTTPFRTATFRSYVGLAVWEDVSITASMKAR